MYWNKSASDFGHFTRHDYIQDDILMDDKLTAVISELFTITE